MWNKTRRPAWELLYYLIVIFLGTFLIELRLNPSEGTRRIIELVNIGLIYGGVWVWLKGNEGALIWEDFGRMRSTKEPRQAAAERSSGKIWKGFGRAAWRVSVPLALLIGCAVLKLPPMINIVLIGVAVAWFPAIQIIAM